MNTNKVIALLFKEPKPTIYNIVFYTVTALYLSIGLIKGIDWYIVLAMFVGGCFFWVFMEYIIHRYIFHFKTKNKTIAKIVFAIHGVHHANPHDDDKLYVPIIPALILLAAVTFMLYVFVGYYAFPLLTGFLLMHQLYNYVHLLIHTDKYSDNKIMQTLRRNHELHHKVSSEKNFGVTSVIFDKLFGTN